MSSVFGPKTQSPNTESPNKKTEKMNTYSNTVYALAIRQILLQKAVCQVVLEKEDFGQDADIPMMMHYDGNWVPVEIVTVPESVPEDQRNDDWFPWKMNKSICLSCEDNGYLYADLFDGSNDEADFGKIFEAVYRKLADRDNDPKSVDWLKDFNNALGNGVPQYARALRARLLRQGYTKENPFRPAKGITLTMVIDIPGWAEPVEYTVACLWPSEDTVAFSENDETILVRNTPAKTWLDNGILEIKENEESILKEIQKQIESNEHENA